MSHRARMSPALRSFLTIIFVLFMLALPATLTLGRIRVPAVVDVTFPNPSPYGYTVSLLLFIIPIIAISCWLVPLDKVKISKDAFVRTIALLFPTGVILDFFFSRIFFKFPNLCATLRVPAPALGLCQNCHIFIDARPHFIIGSVPVEEYVFYLAGFMFVLLFYIWLDKYWLAAYSIGGNNAKRATFRKLLRFHPRSLLWAAVLIAAALLIRHYINHHLPAHESTGFPGYFIFLVIAALGPSSILFPSALPVVNWRAFSLVLFVTLLISLLWEATLGVPYGWWDYQHPQMIGIFVTAWNFLPIEAVCVWAAVTFQTIIVYEVIKRWQSSGKRARHAFLG
jgi:hypothetical protein